MKVYISGPITGTTDYMERFRSIEERMAAAGIVAINPAKVNAQLPGTLSHAEYMKTSIAMLDMCEAVYMMAGWQQSKGCNIEFEYACEHGIAIYFEVGKIDISDILPSMDGFMLRRFMEVQ